MSKCSVAGKDDTSFCPELFCNITNPPLNSRLGRLEVALNVIANRNSQNSTVKSRAVKRKVNSHCQICDENLIYKVPPNSEVKFTQFSKLTSEDMKDALYANQKTKYETLDKLMKLVHSEQALFQNFLTSLNNKFSVIRSKIPSPWYQFAEDRFKQVALECFPTTQNFRLHSTHVLNASVASAISPSMETFGQLLGYGRILEIRLPKLGQVVKGDIGILHRPAKVIVPKQSFVSKSAIRNKPNVNSEPLVVCSENSASKCEENQTVEESLDNSLQIMITSSDNITDVTVGGEELDRDIDSESNEVNVDNKPTCVPSSSEKSENETSSATPVSPTDGTSLNSANASEDKLNSGKNISQVNHIKVAISHDLDVFITDVPVNSLEGNYQECLSHDQVKEFLLGLKVAECIANIDSLCYVFSTAPPDFKRQFSFKIDVLVQEDKSRYFKISEPLPNSKVTAESLKQNIISDILVRSCRQKEIASVGDANKEFLQYLQECGAQPIQKSDSQDLQTQLKDFIEPLKFTSYLPWKNVNSKSMGDLTYSMFSLMDTNVIVHSKQPFMTNFEGSFEKTVIYVKPQYCYEYGLTELTDSEYGELYFRALVLGCVGAAVLHVDMKSLLVVHVDKLFLEDIAQLFPRAEAINRLNSFFSFLRGLQEGQKYLYTHDTGQGHGVLYQELHTEHIPADLVLKPASCLEIDSLSTPVKLSKTILTSWQRHNLRLPMCFPPRKAGTYFCHEYLCKTDCSKTETCAFAHITKSQLQYELGDEKFKTFMTEFEKPKEEKLLAQNNSTPNFGKILHKKQKKNKSNRAKRAFKRNSK